MCKCHRINKESGKVEHTAGLFSLRTGLVGETFQFEHESFHRKILEINYKNSELFAPPMGDYSGLDERGEHTFHLTFKANFIS